MAVRGSLNPDTIRKLIEKGASIPDVAKKLDASYPAVAYHVRKHKIRYVPDIARNSRKLIPNLAGLVASGMTSGEIARQHGVGYKLVWKWIRHLEIPYQHDQSGSRNPSWKGGRRAIGPYFYVWCPEHPFATTFGCVLEHRLVMEKKLGRYLRPDEVVHHKRGYKNTPGNLKLFSSNADHLAATLKGKIPNWTEDGRRRISEGARQPRGPRKKPIRCKLKKHASQSRR